MPQENFKTLLRENVQLYWNFSTHHFDVGLKTPILQTLTEAKISFVLAGSLSLCEPDVSANVNYLRPQPNGTIDRC